MLKKLVKVGNSKGLVIDQWMRNVAGIGSEGFVQIIPYGDFFILGSATAPAPPPPPKSEGIATLMMKLDVLGMGTLEFARFSHDGCRLGLFIANSEAGRPVDAITIARLRRAYERRTTLKESWPETIEAVLAEFPDAA